MRQKQGVSEDRADGKEGRKQAAKQLPVRAVSYPPLHEVIQYLFFLLFSMIVSEVFPPPFFQPYQMGNQGSLRIRTRNIPFWEERWDIFSA